MKRQGTRERGNKGPGNRDQATGNSAPGRLEELVRRAMPKVNSAAEPEHDLWPVLAARIRESETPRPEALTAHVPWYDWALAAGLLLFGFSVPVSIPVLLYYL